MLISSIPSPPSILSFSSFLKVIRKKYHERGHVGCVKCIASGGHYLASGGTDEAIKSVTFSVFLCMLMLTSFFTLCYVRLYDLRKHFDVGTLLHHEGQCGANVMTF